MAASPSPEIFVAYDSSGVPVTGAAAGMSFAYYGTEAGVPITAPAITEIGTTGVYKFTPPAPPSGHGTVYVLVTGQQPARYFRYIRPEESYIDLIADIKQFLFGKWRIFTSGGNANRQVVYQADGTTELVKFDLNDGTNPSVINPLIRTPV